MTLLRTTLLALLAVFALALSGCASIAGWFAAQQPFGGNSPGTAYRTPDQIRQPLSREEAAVLASAETLIGRAPESRVTVNGRTFVLDCIGTVSAIFYGVNIDIQKDFPRYSGNGVSRLYQSLQARGVLHTDRTPRPGDVIFWDNTWDSNGNGIMGDDPRTHAGVVVGVDDDGTIRYVHEHVRRGVVVEVMNLRHPGDYYDSRGKVINNAIALGSGISRKDNPAHWVAGDLWNSFGDVLRIRRQFAFAQALPDASDAEGLMAFSSTWPATSEAARD
jgi:hypothetical protein